MEKIYIVHAYDKDIVKIFNNKEDAEDYRNVWNDGECGFYHYYVMEYEVESGRFEKVKYEGDYYYWMKRVNENKGE